MPSEKTITKCSETRRSTKPIMEKRRRARINNSLTELKNLILDALKKDNARHSKLEKADILEMTVKHLQNLQLQQQHQTTVEPSALAKFRSGFAECANEVSRFFGRAEGGVDPVIRQRLLGHLANCLSGMNTPLSTASPSSPLHVQVNNDSSSDSRMQHQQPLLGGVQLVPTRLPSGDIAFLLPAQLSVYAPATVPVSPASSSSLSSCSGPSLSPLPNVTCGSPINVLGSSGILSPAASDRCTPSPVSYTKLQDVHSSQIQYHHHHHSIPMTPPVSTGKLLSESESVWRPW